MPGSAASGGGGKVAITGRGGGIDAGYRPGTRLLDCPAVGKGGGNLQRGRDARREGFTGGEVSDSVMTRKSLKGD